MIKVLVIPAGSGMAITAIKALKQAGDITVFSADVNMLAPGLYLSHKGYLVPHFTNETFYQVLKGITKMERINVIIPALDTILLEFSERANEFEGLGVHVLISTPETIRITRDKWETYLRLRDSVPMPKSFNKNEEVDLPYPLFVKPRAGSGSKHSYQVGSKKELDFFCDYIEDPIIQEYLSGKEYTVDCLADMDGKLLLCIPRERIEIRNGISTKATVIQNRQLEDMAERITRGIKLKGPFFFQAKEDENGKPKLIEVNARVAGTMCPFCPAKENIHILAVRICLGENVPRPEIRYGTYITRYWEEIYLDEKAIEAKLGKSLEIE